MAKFSVEKVRAMMNVTSNIRNISVIAHVDHGKSTLTDSLVGRAGIIAERNMGDTLYTAARADEQKRGITIKSTSVSLYYERDDDKGKQTRYLINLIDSPGHVDFSSEVTAALRVTDGALVVVDCIEGVCVQTETVLRQAIGERIRPVLFLNKLDRVFLELQPTLEECYLSMRKSIESVNVVCQTYKDEKLGFIELLPDTGRVGFGSGLHAWGFTLMDFGKMYASKFGLSVEKMMQKLWGDNYWDPSKKEWVKKPLNDKMMRGFCQFVLHPIKKLFDSVMSGKKEEYTPLLKALRLKLDKKDMEQAQKPKDMMKLVMRTWIPAGRALLDMIVTHLPSPAEAQRYRVENLYSGPLDSLEAMAVRECDSKGPTSMYVSKMVPWTDKGRFVAFGRVFSGTIRTGQEIRILGPDYEPGNKKDLHVKKIQRCLLMMGRFSEPIYDCPAGNVCGLLGVDEYLLKSGTLTDSESFSPFHTMKFSVAAVVQVAVTAKNATDLPKLVEGLKRLSKSDQIVKVSTSKSGEHIISGAGELHLEICLKDLREDFMNDAEITVSEPIVSFAETISQRTGEDKKFPTICSAKSPNRHNRLFMHAAPLSDAFVQGVESGDVHTGKISDLNTYARELSSKYGWDINDGKKIWTFGCPPDGLPNVVVDATKGVQFLHEIQELVSDAFREVTKGGVLCGEVMRGVGYYLDDATLHADGVHRGPGQIIPCAKKIFYGCQLASGPRLLEPMYLVEITVSIESQSGVYSTLNARRGEVVDIQERPGTPLSVIRAHLPVLNSFGFTQLLRENTGGKAFPQMRFSHWKEMPGDPMKEGTPAYIEVMKTRKRQGMKGELPVFNDYYDKPQM